MHSERATGAIASGIDYRDGIAAVAIASTIQQAPLPPEFRTNITQYPVLDQSKTPSCVAHAWVIIMQAYWFRKTGKVINFSPRFLDIVSAESWIPLDGGRVPRNVARMSVQFGCCTTDLLPNNTSLPIHEYRDPNVLTDLMFEEAKKYALPGYLRINDDMVDDFRRGVHTYGLVSGLFSIGNEFWVPSWQPEHIMPLRPPQVRISGHQMPIYGWNGDNNELRNSWGTEWGMKGNGIYNAQEWLPSIMEGWVAAEIPEDVLRLLQSLPRPENLSYFWRNNMQRGEYSQDVKFAQIALMILGHLKPVTPDELGFYGPRTEKAVLAFQSSQRIFPTSAANIGPQTRKALNNIFRL